MESGILNIGKKEKIEHKIIRAKTGLKDIGGVIKLQKQKYAGHILRKKEDRLERRIEGYTPWDQICGRGRPQIRWRDEF